MGSLDSSNLLLLLRDTLGDKRLVLDLLLLLGLDASALEGAEVTAALQAERGDETLNFRTIKQISKVG